MASPCSHSRLQRERGQLHLFNNSLYESITSEIFAIRNPDSPILCEPIKVHAQPCLTKHGRSRPLRQWTGRRCSMGNGLVMRAEKRFECHNEHRLLYTTTRRLDQRE